MAVYAGGWTSGGLDVVVAAELCTSASPKVKSGWSLIFFGELTRMMEVCVVADPRRVEGQEVGQRTRGM